MAVFDGNHIDGAGTQYVGFKCRCDNDGNAWGQESEPQGTLPCIATGDQS